VRSMKSRISRDTLVSTVPIDNSCDTWVCPRLCRKRRPGAVLFDELSEQLGKRTRVAVVVPLRCREENRNVGPCDVAGHHHFRPAGLALAEVGELPLGRVREVERVRSGEQDGTRRARGTRRQELGPEDVGGGMQRLVDTPATRSARDRRRNRRRDRAAMSPPHRRRVLLRHAGLARDDSRR
jgi:hypothetical protein